MCIRDSYTKIEQAIYDWFDNYLGYASQSRLDIQRIVLAKENNKQFEDIINKAKENSQIEKERILKQKAEKNKVLNPKWNIPERDFFNEYFEVYNYKKYILEPCYLKKKRSTVEEKFEGALDQSDKVKWWYKNGERNKTYLGIQYEHNDSLSTFYPDFIVGFKDKKIGLFETKLGKKSICDVETLEKSDILRDYINKNEKRV